VVAVSFSCTKCRSAVVRAAPARPVMNARIYACEDLVPAEAAGLIRWEQPKSIMAHLKRDSLRMQACQAFCA